MSLVDWIARAGCVLGIMSCNASPQRFGTHATASAVAAAMATDPTPMHSQIEQLVAARMSDTPVENTYYHLSHTHLNSAQFMFDQFTALGYSPMTDAFELDGGMIGKNIVVEIPGTRFADQVVLLTGHLDAWFSGADDNGSALSVLLAAAKAFRGMTFDRTIRIVAFDFEETGLQGSQHYLLTHPSDHFVVMLNMDCVGFASHTPGSQQSLPGLQLSSTGDFLAVLANGAATDSLNQLLQVSTMLDPSARLIGFLAPDNGVTPATSAFLRSDHAPFWRANIPTLFFTDTADFRNPNYHKATDTIDTVDFDFLATSARVIVGATAAYATAE